MDEFDQPYRTVMDRAKAKAAETWKDEPAAAPVARRRPSAMVNPPALNVPTLAAFAAAAVFALIFGVSIFGRPPAETSEHPSYTAPTDVPAPTAVPAASPVPPAAQVENDAAPASSPHSASEGVAAEGFIEPVNCAREPGAWGCEPTPVPAPPVPVQAAPAGPVAPPVAATPAELTPAGCPVNPDGSTCYESVTVLGTDGSAVELGADGATLRQEPGRDDNGLGSMPKPCTHPRCEGGQP